MTESMKKLLEKDSEIIRDPEMAAIYRNCFATTWDTTLTIREDGKSYIITGDIEAMWLRDSSMQVLPYLRLTENELVRNMFRGLIAMQTEQILTDPYANAFNRNGDYACWSKDHTEMGPYIWERKYEVDSLAFPIFLLIQYYEKTQDQTVFTDRLEKALKTILAVWKKEQRHTELSDYHFERDSDLVTETLKNHGMGSSVGYTGMTWSGFRPSDDACQYHYLIPSNMLAVSVLKGLQKLPVGKSIQREAIVLAEEIEKGIYTSGVVEHEKYGRMFAYETDGLGHWNLMDDANLPSLLGAPWFGFCEPENKIYQNTRRFLLSKDNPYYQEGRYAAGIGSPHTPKGYVWHIALAVQGLTAQDPEEKKKLLEQMKNTTAGTLHMHESFDPDHPKNYTRSWFAWADSMFCLLAADYYKLS